MSSSSLRLGYEVERAASFERLENLCKSTNLSTLGSTLVRRGIIVVPSFASEMQVRECLESVPPHSLMRPSREGWAASFVDDADSFKSFEFFFRSSLITNFVSEAFGGRADLFRSQVQSRQKSSTHGPDERPHVDTWRERIKVFLYLTDVTPSGASLMYYSGSHRDVNWPRIEIDEAVERSISSGEYAKDGFAKTASAAGDGILGEADIEELRKRGMDPFPVLCSAGTLVAFDARGVHYVTPTQAARRVALMSYWIREGRHP